MSRRGDKVSRGIRSFAENPVTNLVKGIALLLVGFSDASHSLQDDLTHGPVRLGHGLIIIGLFSILDALPHFVEGLGAWARYYELREKKVPATKEPDNEGANELYVSSIHARTPSKTGRLWSWIETSLRWIEQRSRGQATLTTEPPIWVLEIGKRESLVSIHTS